MLFLYAIAFSIAYLDLDTGTGALILFGSVQLTIGFCLHNATRNIILFHKVIHSVSVDVPDCPSWLHLV